jgi:hypothetical protein
MMPKSKVRRPLSWVVYRVTIKGQADGPNAVCEQAEWEAIERDRPGLHTLIRSGIASEGEAERLARGTSGDRAPRGAQPATPVLPAVTTLPPTGHDSQPRPDNSHGP